jgi:sRNA-binding protein
MDQAEADIARLAELFGNAFIASETADHRPLAVGLDSDLRAIGIMSDERTRAALERYTTRPAYLRCLTPGAKRIDLNGRVRGTVNRGEAFSAARRLAKIL